MSSARKLEQCLEWQSKMALRAHSKKGKRVQNSHPEIIKIAH